MKPTYCLLLLLALTPARHAIRCLCDGPQCVSGSGPDEECPGEMSEEYKKRHLEITSRVHNEMPDLDVMYENCRRKLNNETLLSPEEEEKFREKSALKWSTIPMDQQNQIKAAMKALTKMLLASLTAQMESGSEEQKIFDNVFFGNLTIAPVNMQYCVSILDGEGKTLRACGLNGVGPIGVAEKEGCFENPDFNEATNNFPKYCRCDTDLCNAEDMVRSSSGSKSLTISTFLLVALVMKTFVY